MSSSFNPKRDVPSTPEEINQVDAAHRFGGNPAPNDAAYLSLGQIAADLHVAAPTVEKILTKVGAAHALTINGARLYGPFAVRAVRGEFEAWEARQREARRAAREWDRQAAEAEARAAAEQPQPDAAAGPAPESVVPDGGKEHGRRAVTKR